MYELIQVGTNTYVIDCPAKIGLFVEGERAFLIDSGNDKDAGKKVLKILESRGWQLAAILNTHSHADHIGGAQAVLENIPVGTVYIPAVSASTVTFERLMDCILENEIDAAAAYAGMEIPFGSCSLRVLSPPQDFSSENLNEYSVVLLLGFVFMVPCYAFFRFGLKRYKSTGS